MSRTILTNGQAEELRKLLPRGLPKQLPKGIAQGWIESSWRLERAVKRTLFWPDTIEDEIERWHKFYKEVCGFTADCSWFVHRKVATGRFTFPVVVPQAMMYDHVLEMCRKVFPTFRCSLTSAKIKQWGRDAHTGSYAVWVVDCEDPDVKLREGSLSGRRQQGMQFVTLREFLLLLGKHYYETGELLHEGKRMMCLDTTTAEGYVPDVLYYSNPDDEVRVTLSGTPGAPFERDGFSREVRPDLLD